MNENGRTPRHKLKEDHPPEGPEENYSVHVGGKIGLQRISVLARSDQEAISKLTGIAGDNPVHTDTFTKNGVKLPRSRWRHLLRAAGEERP